MGGLNGMLDGIGRIFGGPNAAAGRQASLEVRGRGVVSAEPDLVVLTFDLKGRDESYGAAVDDLNRRVEVLRSDLAEAAGVRRERLKTLQFDVDPKYGYDYGAPGGGREVFKGYEASHKLRLELPLDRDLMNLVLDRVAGSASEATLRVSFDASDKEGLRRRALRAAVEDARGIAGVLSESAGLKLEGIERAWHGPVNIGGRDREFVGLRRARAGGGADPDIEPRALEAAVEVSIVYQVS